MSKHDHLGFDPKLGHGICAIRRIPCACVGCTSMLYKTWIKQAHYQPVTKCTYSPVMGSYKNWNIIELTPKSTPFEEFDEINKVFLDRISENMASLVQPGMYGVIKTYDTTTHGFHVIKFILEAYMLQKIQQLIVKLFLLAN